MGFVSWESLDLSFGVRGSWYCYEDVSRLC